MNRPANPVVATLTVRVPLGATGSLADGAARIVNRIDAVDAIADPDVRRVSPGLNDTRVELRIRVELEPAADGDLDAIARRELEAGVGVETVECVEPDPPPRADAGSP
ncbi:hypothetical protein [Natrinema salsiterrestre]|uniref:Uncharacterized protein n=1 Tax=Natrinema salsiterrestre TaxID=2950540 RepID=A0A9Q4L1N7_9EURY|nr:hypothetical protein [Natrinema salsiterrestre]MDF9745959.1 hypothetical protein [Natrinema salsiterrestre]